MKFFLLLLLSILGTSTYNIQYITQNTVQSIKWISRVDGSICDVLAMGPASHRLAYESQQTIVDQRPLIHEVDPMGDDHVHDNEGDMLVTAYDQNEETLQALLKSRCHVINYPNNKPISNNADVVSEIIKSGDPANRIDVVLMGDGYTANDQLRMDNDNLRLVNDMFNDVTFASYLPVFNIWSVFRASQEEGIGVGGKPKNTSFGLYRDGTELRGVYCSKQAAAREACLGTGPNACDYPSLIGNDPYYGGLGGEFTITTSSLTSGTIVLRHEMGHNFIRVGEEYDGGSAYSGVNYSPVRNGVNVSWPAWLTEPGNVILEGAQIMVQEYAWYNLALGAWQTNFTTDGTAARWGMRYSVSGCDTPGAISITLDGQAIPWQTKYSLDRFIYDVQSSTPLPAGTHRLVFTQLTPPPAGNPIRQLCSVTLHEYKAEPQFHMNNPNYIGAYPTWRQGKVLAGYRPGNEKCLMRNMSSTAFCSVCYEGMWMNFFSIMGCIDGVQVICQANSIQITLSTPKLGQLRAGGAEPGEYLSVRWTYNNTVQNQFNDHFTIAVDRAMSGSWRVEVDYKTQLVRSDPNKLLHFVRNFNVPMCG